MSEPTTSTLDSAATRQQRGWHVAQQAAQVLQEKFSAQKVVLFGSMLNSRHIRSTSDIDLAVWGLPTPRYDSAVAQLLDLDTDFLIDLVQFELAPPSLRQSILTTGVDLDQAFSPPFLHTAQSMTQHAALLGLIFQNLDELAQLIGKVQRLHLKYQQTNDEDYLGTLALKLHSFYTGAERIFREIARAIDGSLPDSADWHRRLLRQMSAEIPDIRQPVITQATRARLDEYCAFRHVVRNIYALNLRGDRLYALTQSLPDVFHAFRQECMHFCQSLTEKR